VRYKVHGGWVESASRRAAEIDWVRRKEGEAGVRRVRAGGGVFGGKQGYMEINSVIERGVVRVLCDLLLACGPRTLVVVEDFVLGTTGGGGPGGRGNRDGLSPVRIASRFDQVLWDEGFITGDAWRVWQGHPWTGADDRGWKVVDGLVPGFKKRLTAAERWRLGELGEFGGGDAVWGGMGVSVVWQMASARSWFPAGVRAMDDWLRENGMWKPGRRHGMDALEHLCVVARRMGAEVREKPESIWFGGSQPDGKGVSGSSPRAAAPTALLN